jgi:glycosyltransferase involved in cell wall biosynthesis
MKISVLIPSRNRLSLLQAAVETVRRQANSDWEIVISDNHSDEDYAAYVRTLNDPRIVFRRTEQFVSVTENWNRCFDAATGDYIVMLGDDDGLTPHYMERMRALIAQFDHPDFIYHSAWHYVYPDALLAEPESRLVDITPMTTWFADISGPMVLPKEKSLHGALNALAMRSLYGFNMQYFLFSAAFIKTLKQYGPVFQGPFPDFYAAQMAMLLSTRAVITPEPLVFIGISPKSYGFYFYNGQEDAGAAFLNSLSEKENVPQAVLDKLLPGSNMNTSWLMSVSIVRERLKNTWPDLPLGVTRYRLLQIRDALSLDGSSKSSHIDALWPRLTLSEKSLVLGLRIFMAVSIVLPGAVRERVLTALKIRTAEPKYSGKQPDGRYATLLDAFESVG